MRDNAEEEVNARTLAAAFIAHSADWLGSSAPQTLLKGQCIRRERLRSTGLASGVKRRPRLEQQIICCIRVACGTRPVGPDGKRMHARGNGGSANGLDSTRWGGGLRVGVHVALSSSAAASF